MNDDDNTSIHSLANTTVSKARKLVDPSLQPIILNFIAYFEERPEGERQVLIRICNIYFYTEDGTIKVVEKPQDNSGVTQGTLVRRAIINKTNGTPFIEEDFRTGAVITIYGRNFHLVDADPATKDYLARTFGITFYPSPLPEDPYTKFRKTLEPGTADSWGKFRAKRDENKIFNEAKLGNTVDNSGREGFNRYGALSLKFRCVWDNTENLYGDVLEYSLQYYLSDDTLEINSIPNSLTKDGNRMKLLKRSKLPKDFHLNMTLGERPPSAAFFHWTDLFIGLEVEVYARNLRIVDADGRTRDFYEEQGMPLGPPIVQPSPEVVVHQREVPPPTGFGSEEDSLRSVEGSLMPGPPPQKKYGENKTLVFLASLLSGTIDDKDRRFVISVYITDNTVKVVEPPMRNSGFSGGTFLSRRVIKKANGDTLTYEDFYVGCRLRVLMHEFLILNTSEGTLRWMEDKGLPRSSFYPILDKIRPAVLSDAQNGFLSAAFQEVETPEGGPGNATIEGLKAVLSRYDLINGRPNGISEHELMTIVRANGNKLPTFNYEKFIEQIIKPTDEFR
eukprot:scaffold2721_cov181-Ochromonas_danica.AAC.2